MSTNKYFNNINNSSEQDLFQSLVTESIKIHGTDVLYIKRDIPELDKILGEPKFSTFKNTYTIEMYAPDGAISVSNNFSMSKFGWLVDDNLELVVSSDVWEKSVYPFDNTLKQPHEGDLIYIGESLTLNSSYINTVYEIVRVKLGNETRFEFGSNYMFTLSCKVYSPNHDDFDTDGLDLDDFLNDNTHKTEINDDIDFERLDSVIPNNNPFGEL